MDTNTTCSDSAFPNAKAAQEKRKRQIAQINARLKPPTADELRSLREHHVETWGDYIAEQADNCGVSIGRAYSVFNMLGESEAFDGFVTTLEDMEGQEDE